MQLQRSRVVASHINSFVMHTSWPLFGLISLAAASPLTQRPDPHGNCQEVEIPITVLVPRFEVTTGIKDDWDAAALSFNLTRRDFTSPADPVPIASDMTEPRQSTYNISATICGKGDSVLVLTHGIIESKL